MTKKVGRPKGLQKTGGRKKGSLNHLTKELKNSLKNILADELGKMPELLEQLDTKDRLDTIIKLLPYTMPKVEATAYHMDEPLTIETIELETI